MNNTIDDLRKRIIYLKQQKASGVEGDLFTSLIGDLLTSVSVSNRDVLLSQLTCDDWLDLISLKPRWWIFRGPFSTEAYKEEYRERLIDFLLGHPDLADLYFCGADWMTSEACEPIREVLSTDPRIIALRMAMI